MTTISEYNHFALIEACKIAAKSNSSNNLFLPKFVSGSPVHAFIMKGQDANANYGFWYAGIIVSDENKDTVLSITLIPQQNGNLMIAKTMVQNKKILKLKIVESMEAEGISFGGFNLSKMEVKIHYHALRTALFESKTTITIHDRFGRKLEDSIESQLPPKLPKTDLDPIIQPTNLTSQNNFLQSVNQDVRLFQAVDTAESDNKVMFQFLNEKIDASNEAAILESEINGDSLIELNAEEIRQLDDGAAKTPGVYIEIANQGGIASLCILLMYSIDENGSFYPIMFNQCSSTVYTHFRDKFRKSKSSGLFSSRVKIKRVLKYFSVSNLSCGEIKTANELKLVAQAKQSLNLVEGKGDESQIESQSNSRGGGFIEKFRNAIAKIHALRDDPSSKSKFPNLDFGHYTFSLENRVRNPKIINQGPLKLCGPAAYLYLLASIDPEGYANVALDLILKGSATYANQKFIPHPDMVNQHPQTYPDPIEEGVVHVMDAVDWLTMSALRDGDTDFFWPLYDPKTNTGAGGLTTHWEMSSWINNIDNVKEQRVSGALSASQLNDAYNSGKRIVLLINVRAFINKSTVKKISRSEDKMSSIFAPIFGDHYVVIDSPIHETAAQDYSFAVWTWGKYWELSMSKSQFEDAVITTFIIRNEN